VCAQYLQPDLERMGISGSFDEAERSSEVAAPSASEAPSRQRLFSDSSVPSSSTPIRSQPSQPPVSASRRTSVETLHPDSHQAAKPMRRATVAPSTLSPAIGGTVSPPTSPGGPMSGQEQQRAFAKLINDKKKTVRLYKCLCMYPEWEKVAVHNVELHQ
jgi:hypothetical protein